LLGEMASELASRRRKITRNGNSDFVVGDGQVRK